MHMPHCIPRIRYGQAVACPAVGEGGGGTGKLADAFWIKDRIHVSPKIKNKTE